MKASWISVETEPKEHDFRGILGMHMNICKGIRSRRPGPPYLYMDLHGGPGDLEFGGKAFAGSPVIFLEEAARCEIPFRSAHFEADPDTATALNDAMVHCAETHAQTFACLEPSHFLVRPEPFEAGVVSLARNLEIRHNTLGLIYSDPIRDPIPHVHLAQLAQLLPKVDLMAYVSATQYKRRNGALRRAGRPLGPRLADDIARIPKSVVLIREPHTAWQWTFILWSNWVNFPEWRRQGFVRLDSAQGQRILMRLNHTDPELHDLSNEPLPFSRADLPYRTYREYLRHPRFLKVRAQVFARAAGKSERCGLRPPTEPHHLRYPPWGEFDVPENMIAVCHPCHCEIHGKAS